MTYSHAFAILDVSQAAYDEIRARLVSAGYSDILLPHEGHEVIDFNTVGIGLRALVRRQLVCDCGNRDDDEVSAETMSFPPCSAACGRTMRLETMDRCAHCGHTVAAHEDLDGGTHECQLCSCVQYLSRDDVGTA